MICSTSNDENNFISVVSISQDNFKDTLSPEKIEIEKRQNKRREEKNEERERTRRTNEKTFRASFKF